MDQGVGIGMPQQSLLVVHLHPTDNQAAAFGEAVTVIPEAHSHGNSLS
jgi:hypothetical protein